MKFVFKKPDMDTVLAAMILGFNESKDDLILTNSEIQAEVLADKEIFCIECGGSGQLNLKNFDHHDPFIVLPCACVQAYLWKKNLNNVVYNLVKYVQYVDEGLKKQYKHNNESEISLSGIYSGMRLKYKKSLIMQFNKGIELFKTICQKQINPWKPLPKLYEWNDYITLKKIQLKVLDNYLRQAEFFYTFSGIKFGFLTAPTPGIHGLLRRAGCSISIASGLYSYNNNMYYSISSDDLNISYILSDLLILEKGWGGPSNGRIIASPQHGSLLPKQKIINIVKERM